MDEPILRKKRRLMDKSVKEQKKILVIATMFLVTLFFGTSYALLSFTSESNNAASIKVGNMNGTVTTSEDITLEGKIAETDASGLANANPVLVTVTNTGTIPIQKYVVKLLHQQNASSNLEYQYIKYAISTDGTNYIIGNTLAQDNNIIYNGYGLGITNDTKTQTFYIKVWIDETAGSNGSNKQFIGSVSIEFLSNTSDIITRLKSNNTTDPTCQNPDNLKWVDTDGTTYISGSKDCIDFNYVWYSGKMWRIVAIYPDGAMKIVTDNNITSIAFGESGGVNFYTDKNTTSYMYQWLNEDFYDTLYNASNFIDTSKKWNATLTTTVSDRPGNDMQVSANVGLLNSYEYYNSYRCNGSTTCQGSTYGTGYLNNSFYWWLLNPYSTSNVWRVYSTGSANSDNFPTTSSGARPSIYLKSGLSLTGNGTSSSPYKIVGDKETGKTNELINNRLSGEYVKLKNETQSQVFRIVGVEDTETKAEDNKTKIVAMDYADGGATRKFATSTGSSNTLWGSNTTTGEDTWYTYLNKVDDDISKTGYYDKLEKTYGEIFAKSTYYFGTSGYNYKLSICANTTSGNTKVCTKTSQQLSNANIGLLRYGEMFATQQKWKNQTLTTIWLINRRTTLGVWFVNNAGNATSSLTPTYSNGARPSVHLSSSVKILECDQELCDGTPDYPYVVGLKS